MWLITVESFEWGTLQGRVVTGVIPQLGLRQPFLPFLRGLINCTTKKHLQTLVHSFTLAICLRMVCCACGQSNAHEFEKLLPKMCSEDLVPVRHNGFG
jgi:hypothetical protein